MKLNYSKLGDYIKESKLKNKDSIETNLVGLSNEKQFTDSKANIIGTDLSKYKLITYNQFVYMPTTSRNGDKISIALFKEEGGIISSSYTVFDVDFNLLNPDYLMLWFERPEFDRYARYHSHGSVREIFSWEDMQNIELYVPPLEYQNKVVKIKNLIDNRIAILTRLNKNLTSLSLNIFKEILFSDEEQEFIELKEVCKFIKGRKPTEISEKYHEGFENYLTIDVLSNQSQSYAYDEKGVGANEYDILMVMDGASSGKLFYGKQGLVGSTLAKLDVKKSYLELIYQFLKFNEKFISDNTTGSAIPHTDKGLVLNLKCPISDRLLKCSNTFKDIRSAIISNNNEILKLQKLRDTLLPKLMSGEIDVNKINCDLDVAYS